MTADRGAANRYPSLPHSPTIGAGFFCSLATSRLTIENNFRRSLPTRLCPEELFQAIQGFPYGCDASPEIGATGAATQESSTGLRFRIGAAEAAARLGPLASWIYKRIICIYEYPRAARFF